MLSSQKSNEMDLILGKLGECLSNEVDFEVDFVNYGALLNEVHLRKKKDVA